MIKYITLWEIIMIAFEPDQFFFMGGMHTAWKMFPENSSLTQERRQDWLHDVEAAETLCHKLGLTYSELAIQRIKDLLSQNTKISSSELLKLNDELDHRLIDEMKSRKFLCIEPDKLALLDEKNLFGGEVTEAFPSAIVDIEEAGNCLAFERWTAAVFHLSRVAEITTVQIGKRVGYESHKEGFGQVLRYMDTQLEKVRKDYKNASPLFKGDMEFFAAVTAQMHAVNQAWRQRVAHLDKKYTEEEALRIWLATKGLMEQMAKNLNEANTS